MAEYHMLSDNLYSVGGMEENQSMMNTGNYGHGAPMNVGGSGMMSQSMAISPAQNPSGMMQGMVPMQQSQATQPGSQIPLGNMGSYHQGSVHGFSQNEVPQKLHQYAAYGSQMPSGNTGSQYMPGGPRLHHIGDTLTPSSPQQQQSPRAMVPNQMAYQNRSMGGNHYGQQIVHTNAASAQMSQQSPARYPNQYAPVPHHQFQQHSMQQMNQNTDLWQGSMNHPQLPRQCMPQVQSYPPTHQSMPAQHGNSSLAHSPLTLQGQRPSTPNQSQYVGSQEYPVQQQHASAQAAQMQRSPVYNLNSSTINQNGTHMGQAGTTPQPVMPQPYGSLPQNEQGMFPQGHYTTPSQAAPARPHYNPSSTSGSAVSQSPQQPHLVGQQPMMGMRPSMHQMGYSPVSSRVNSGQQHSGALPPGSPARVQQYHPPFSPNQGYPTAAQPSPRSVTGETATPPHIPHYSQTITQSPTSPQYRNQFPPSQLTQSPQHLAATPPAEASAPTSSCTPDRSRHSTPVPQSQGSFPSPSTTHMTSPGQGHSPGNSNAPPSSSLQHLEQMVLPHVVSGNSTPSNTAVVSVGSSTAPMSHSSTVSGNYYSHIHAPSQEPQQQPHLPHMSSTSDPHPPPPSPLSHVPTQPPHPHHNFVGHSVGPQTASQQTSSLGSVPNSQPVPPATLSMNTLPKTAASVEDTNLLETNQRNSMIGYSPLSSSNSSGQGIIQAENTLSQHTVTPAVTHVQAPNPVPSNHVGPLPASNPPSMAIPPHQHPVGSFQGSSTSVSYEIQQIQQELQKLHAMNKNAENQEEINSLQERLRYLQSQKLESPVQNAMAMNVPSSGNSIPAQYPRPPMMYGSGNQMPYIHQQPMQPHTVHYNPQTQQAGPVSQERPMPVLGPQPSHIMNDMYHSGNSCGPLEQDAMDSNSASQHCYPPHTSEAPMPVMPPSAAPVDPYELNFNDEPPKKMKRRPPKEPKEPKPPKEKKPPKPKKPKKAKIEDIVYFPEDFIGPLPENAQRMENMEPGTNLPPNPDGSITPNVSDKKKKSRKRKTKEKENDEPSSEPKEPKPKKPKKKSSKKQSKENVTEKVEGNEQGINESGEHVITLEGESVVDGETSEVIGEDKKEKKDGKVKSPKTSGSGKENKKSTPKKKLPKLALRFPSKKKKKKRSPGSPDNSDMEKTPPPSPDDGEGVQKRRSARNTNRKKYTDDIELHLTDDETIEMEFGQSSVFNSDGKLVQVVMDSHIEDHMVVEKILAVRLGSKQPESKPSSDIENSDSVVETSNVEEYYVKYKNLSYIHCEWRTAEELEKGDRRFLQKVKRFKQKKAEFNFFDFLEDEPFNPDYIEVDRVLDVNEIFEPKSDENIDAKVCENSAEKECIAQDENQKTPVLDNEDSDKSKDKVLEPLEETNQNDVTTLPISPKPNLELSNCEATNSESRVPTNSLNIDDKESSQGENNSSNIPESDQSELKEETDEKESSVSVSKSEKDVKVVRHYLVKWRALTYEESTWELEEDVDRNKIEHFERFRYPPPKEKWKVKKRPIPSKWMKIEDSPIYKGDNTLREYQLEGVNWLTFCWYNGQNCILADEMGLGKTIQSIAFLNEIDKYGIPGPFLVIAPLSTIGNWQREFETWTDLNTITYHGSSPSRNMILDYEMYWKNEQGERIQEVYKFQVLITTFEIILTDCMELKVIPWRCVVIDEAHRLKNRNCKLLEGLRLLNTEHRVLLTGTPLQNNVEELFSLLNFLEPNRFASTEAFLEEFGDLKTEAQVDKLKALLKPMMLRRLKEDVEKSLAPKEETVVEVELTNIQKKYYRAILERNFTFLTKGNCYSNIPNLMNTMMELRKCCIHPFLITGAEEQIIIDYKSQHEDCTEVQLNAMIQASGKLVLIDKLLPRLRADGHRVLVFSQMVKCLDILEDYMVQRRYPYERIDGRVRGNLRQAAIDRFCKPDSDRFVFLLCTRAGGLGINLTAADTVIIFDSDWNPQNDLQAQARCHRIGQSKAVKVYRLICRNTYEREMFDKASLKLGLDKAVLQSMCPSKENIGMNQQMSKKEIEDLLRKGAYGALMEDDNAGDKFCEEDIDQILQRRTQVIHLESGAQGSTFSKATFASASTRSDIEIDDPNFWEKWAKKANLDVDELKSRNELIIQEPRRRTQTRRFGTDDQMLDLSDLETSDEDDESVSTRTRASKRTSKILGKRPKNRGRALDREKDEEYMEEIAPGNWTRAECFKVEKGLLTFGWGRWDECIALGQFRRRVTHKDCEHISRTILLYCLLHYKGDEKIKSFIWDLICPTYEGEQPIYRNHSGLSAPVPRGRKGKKIKKEVKAVDTVIEESEWAKEEQYNPDVLLNDEAYRKHLNRHANKVLLRVRLLYYLKHEIIGDLHDQVFSGIPASLIPLEVPPADGDPPAPWWDRDVDKSLLLGIYKHGFERYNLMRQDPSLIFLSRCGPPDGAALLAELKFNDEDLAEQASQEEAADKEGKFTYDKEIDDLEPLSPASETQSTKSFHTPMYFSPEKYNSMMMGIPIFPSVTDVNTRVRRLVTAYQRNNKKLEIRNAQKAKKIERREKFEAAIREREMKKRELQQRKWSRREEADFYRTISAFGVEYTEDKKGYNWSRFRNLARLERKYDDTLAEYYKSFYAMCKRVCGRKLTEEEEQLSFVVDPISEERASRCLQRVDLLHKIREEILVHPELDERLKLCQPSMDLPDWWQCGKHDKDLLIGAAKHGLSRMDYHLLHDSSLSFKDVLKNHPHMKTVQIGSHVSTPIGCSSPVTTCLSAEGTHIKDELMSDSGKEELKLLLKDNFESKVEKEPESVEDKALLESEVLKNVTVKSETTANDLQGSENEVTDDVCDAGDIVKAERDSVIKVEPSVCSLDDKSEKFSDVEVTKVRHNEDNETKPEDNQNETDRDEETDIETDLKREDDVKEAMEVDQYFYRNTVREVLEARTPEPPVLEEQEKCSKKYECDTGAILKPVHELQNEIKYEMEVVDDKDLFLSKAPVLDTYSKLNIGRCEMERKESVIKEALKEEIHMQVEDSMNDEVMSQASFNLETELGEPTVAQLLAITSGNVVRWPKDKVLQIRLEHIVQAVEKNEWPIIRPAFLAGFPGVGVPTTSTSPSALPPVSHAASPSPHRSSPAPSVTSREGHSREPTPLATPEPPPLVRELVLPDVQVPPPSDFGLQKQSPIPSSTSMPAGDGVKHRRRRRRRRFEIEAERAKLRQLLSHNMQQQQQHHQQQMQHVQQFLATTNASLLRNKLWEEHSEEKVQIPGVTQATAALVAPPPATSSAPSVPPPAHQNSSPRLSTTLGSLDLRVKASVTPPASFTPILQQSKPCVPSVSSLSKTADAPSSPMDLSASSSGPSGQQSSAKQLVKTRLREGRSSRGGSRIDALALNLQARKQQQLMQEQHHVPLDNISSASDHSDKVKEPSDPEEPPSSRQLSHHHHHHHGQPLPEKRSIEEEETKLRRKRLQYSEDAIRKSLNRAFEMTRAPPAHSSFLNSSITSGLSNAGRMHLGSKQDEQHASSTNPVLDHSGLMHHDFKKWLEEHPELVATNPNLVAAAAAAMAFNPVTPFPSHTELLELPEGRRRGRRPRLDPAKLDYDKVTGEENVSVINRLTGKKITGSKAPPLKHLAEWLDKNPMFDVDPKWGPLVREKGNLPNNMLARIVTPSEKRGRRTAASLLASAHQNLVAPPSTMSFPSASSLNPLSFANTGMLTGFPNMNFFKDPPKVTSTLTPSSTSAATSSSNPPIFLPFGGLAGMGLTNPLFGFPGFNFPSLQGTSSSLGSTNLPLSKDQGKDAERNKTEKATDGSTSRKNIPISTSAVSASSIISSSAMPSATSLPFLYPAPGLLYNPLGLGSFTLPPNLPASFASFTQSGLVNGLGLNSPLITTSPMSTTATSLVSSAITSTIPSASHAALASSLISPKGTGHSTSSKHSPSHSSLHETQDTDDESLKSLMGAHEDEDDEDLDDGKAESFDNLDKDDSDRDIFQDAAGKSPIFSTGRNSAKVSESESETASVTKSGSFRVTTSELHSSKSKVISDDPTSDSTDTESKAS